MLKSTVIEVPFMLFGNTCTCTTVLRPTGWIGARGVMQGWWNVRWIWSTMNFVENCLTVAANGAQLFLNIVLHKGERSVIGILINSWKWQQIEGDHWNRSGGADLSSKYLTKSWSAFTECSHTRKSESDYLYSLNLEFWTPHKSVIYCRKLCFAISIIMEDRVAIETKELLDCRKDYCFCFIAFPHCCCCFHIVEQRNFRNWRETSQRMTKSEACFFLKLWIGKYVFVWSVLIFSQLRRMIAQLDIKLRRAKSSNLIRGTYLSGGTQNELRNVTVIWFHGEEQLFWQTSY